MACYVRSVSVETKIEKMVISNGAFSKSPSIDKSLAALHFATTETRKNRFLSDRLDVVRPSGEAKEKNTESLTLILIEQTGMAAQERLCNAD